MRGVRLATVASAVQVHDRSGSVSMAVVRRVVTGKEQDMTTIPELYAKIEGFLKERCESENNGFAPVSKEDFVAFNEIIDALIEAKWAPDPDGDYPIQTRTVNRHTRQYLQYQAVTYRHKNKKQYRRDVVANLNTALREVILSQELGDPDERFEERNKQ